AAGGWTRVVERLRRGRSPGGVDASPSGAVGQEGRGVTADGDLARDWLGACGDAVGVARHPLAVCEKAGFVEVSGHRLGAAALGKRAGEGAGAGACESGAEEHDPWSRQVGGGPGEEPICRPVTEGVGGWSAAEGGGGEWGGGVGGGGGGVVKKGGRAPRGVGWRGWGGGARGEGFYGSGWLRFGVAGGVPRKSIAPAGGSLSARMTPP